MDPALQQLMAEGAPDDEVAVLLRLSDSTAAPPHVRLIAQFGNIATCRLQRSDIIAVRSSAPVRSMKAARLYGSTVVTEEDPWADENDESANSITEGAIADTAEEQSVIGNDWFDENDWFDDGEALPDRVRESDLRRPEVTDLPTGRGVVIAHIDWGVDIAHPDFRLPDGRTRLLALWDQRGAAFPDRPNRYGYGRIFNRDEINQALLSGDPYGTLGYHPADFDTLRGTHGTHTLSIAAGNGRCGGPLGIAPDADLIFVHLSTYTAEGPTDLGDSVAYFEAVDFVLRTVAALPSFSMSSKAPGNPIETVLETVPEFDPEATQQRLCPVVINSSLGRHGGPHVGRTLVEQGMDAALRELPGRAFVYSTGNYYNRQTHASGTLRPGETHTLRMVVETGGNRSDGQTLSPCEVELWYPGTDRLAVTITAPNGTRFGSVRGDQQSPLQLQLPSGTAPRTIGQLYHRLNDPNNGDNEAMLFLYKGAPTGIYEITLVGEDVADGRYHLWIERNTAGRRAQATFEARDSRTECTTGTICNGFRTIAVGAYDAHAWYQKGDVPETGRPLAPFSSSGLTRDGRQKPDLCAPGVQVLAARSCPRHWQGKAEGHPPPLLTRMSGTSMAAPHITGTIALIFEAATRPLAIEETRRLLLLATDPTPTDVTESARLRIGSGFLNIEAAVAAARAFPHASKQVGRAPVQVVQQAVYSLAADPVLPFKETLQPMNPSYETNEAEAIEAEDAGYYPEYYPDDEAGSDVEAVRDDRQQFRRDGLSARRRIDSPSLGFVLPLGGNSGITPALSFPVGGRQSPFSVAVPLGGTTPPPATPPPVPSAPNPYASPYANPILPIPPIVDPYADPMLSTGGYTPYAPVVVDDPAGMPMMDADEFVAAGSDKSVRPMVEWIEGDVLSNQAFGEQFGNVIYESEAVESEAVESEAVESEAVESEAVESEIDERETDESDETFGERLVSIADALAADPQARSFRSSTYLAALLDAIGQAQALSPLGMASGGHRPSASELYNAFVHSDVLLRPRHHFRQHYAHRFTPVALPGSRLNAADLHPGDIVVRVARGENWGQFSIVASPRLLSPLELSGSPFGGYAPGGYVPVIECMPVPRLHQDNFVRRLTDAYGKTLPDTLVLRVRRSFGEGSGDEAENDSQISPGDGKRPRVLTRGASGTAVRNVQVTLNRYSLQELSAGRLPLDGCPLEEDGKFGPMTLRAVRDFQMRQFSDDASQWDGIVGPRTWEKLDAVDSTPPPIINPPVTDLAALRRSAGALIAEYVPSDTGDGRFDEIAQDYGGKGTTCGYLCHWLLWRLGCTDRNIVNRNEVNGYKYRIGQNIRRIWNGGSLPFVKVLNTGRVGAGERPEKGDIVFIATPGGAATSEHVFVFLEEFQRDGYTYWRSADAGQRNAANQQCARFSERELLIQGKNAVVRRSNGTERTVFGWLPLGNLTFGMPPKPMLKSISTPVTALGSAQFDPVIPPIEVDTPGQYSDVLEMPEFLALDGTRALVAGRLINFATGKPYLQEGHKRWLLDKVMPAILASPNYWIDLYGYASKLGNSRFNLELSQSRAEAVKRFLAQQLASQGKSIEDRVKIDKGFGEDAPGYFAKESDNSSYWRAAEVVVFGSRPTIVRPPLKPPVQATIFKIRVVGGGSASIGLQADNYFFQIVDVTRRQTAFYFYTGAGLGISLPKIPGPGSVTKVGPLTKFRTSRSAELYQFNSRASLFQDPGLTFGSFSVGGTLRLTMNNIQDSAGLISTIPITIPIEGGSGIQMPGLGSVSEGVLALVSKIFPLEISDPLLEVAEWEESVTHTADLADSFFAAMHTVAATLQTQPQFLLAVMNSESGIRASAHNPNGHASGLIQFMPATLRGLGWAQGHEAFRRLTATEQMPFVQRYYLPFVRQGLNSTARLYQTTFLPATLSRGSEPDTVIVDVNNNDNAFAYAPNRGLDRRGDGRILVGDLTAFVERAKGSARWREALERLQASAPGPVPPDPVPPAPLPPMPPGTMHPLLRRGARGNAVREAQTKLNLVHNRNVSIGVPGLQGAPLAVDGIFGVQTYNATVSFQQQVFPADPREWDGIIGSKTWAKLDAASSGVSPPITPPIVPPVPPPAVVVDRRLSRDEVMRWFVGGTDSQGQPMGRVTSNNRVFYLIRGRSTFDAMMRAMRTASTPGHFIYLLGWWMSDDFPVAGGVTMQQLFTSASQAGVTVRAMLWDQPTSPSNLRQNTAEVNRINALPNGAAILDNRTLNIGSHHQKILVVNGSEGLYAFCGGVDINPDRIRTVTTGTFSSGGAGTPLHDVHCQIQGPAAFDLLQIFQQRWNDHPDHVDLDRRKGALSMLSPPAPLPNGREWVQIGRTFGNGNAHRGIDSENLGTRPRGYTFLRGRAGEQTVKRMILHAIRQARRFIYLEDQYLVSLEIRDALIRALPNIEHLTILIPDGSISDLPQGNFRRREFIAPLRAAGGSKVRVFHPHPPRDPFGYVHAKMWVFDDEYAIIGSANCNRRGYTHDSEVVTGICDEGNGEDLRFAHRLRIDLWALHLNMSPASLTDGVASAAYWLRPVGTGRVEPHDENVGIEQVRTDTSWNNVVDPDGS